MIRGLADFALFSAICVATAGAFWARSSAAARRRGWFCMRGKFVDGAIGARFATTTGGEPEQDIMTIGQGSKRFAAALPKSERPGLVPRTRSSHHNCRESGCELRVQSGTRIITLLVSFDSEVRFGACGKSRRTSESGH